MKFYPCADRPFREMKNFGLKLGKDSIQNIKAIYTGEKRKPKKGEWYLSGAIIEAYRAPNDLSDIHLIAKLVLTKTETIKITRIILD